MPRFWPFTVILALSHRCVPEESRHCPTWCRIRFAPFPFGWYMVARTPAYAWFSTVGSQFVLTVKPFTLVTWSAEKPLTVENLKSPYCTGAISPFFRSCTVRPEAVLSATALTVPVVLALACLTVFAVVSDGTWPEASEEFAS